MNAVTAPPVRPTRASWRPGHLRPPSIGRFSAVYLWVVFLLLFGALQVHLFLTVSTFQVVVAQGAVTAFMILLRILRSEMPRRRKPAPARRRAGSRRLT